MDQETVIDPNGNESVAALEGEQGNADGGEDKGSDDVSIELRPGGKGNGNGNAGAKARTFAKVAAGLATINPHRRWGAEHANGQPPIFCQFPVIAEDRMLATDGARLAKLSWKLPQILGDMVGEVTHTKHLGTTKLLVGCQTLH
jgi:hypothetical protein